MREKTLNNPDCFPTDAITEDVLGSEIFKIYQSFRTIITNEEYSLIPEWRFYNDGKS